jgi:cold shock CspA family protein/ribosome-associated translation inhibitor RaiA
MQTPLEISFRDVEKTEEIETLIRGKAEKLDKIFINIISCRIMVEKLQQHNRTSQGFRVRIDLKIPPGHELVVSRDPSKGNLHLDLGAEIRWAFDAAERMVKEVREKQRHDVKSHPQQETQGVIERVFFADGTGFIRSTDGRQIFFHRNSVLHMNFETLKVGMGVRFVEVQGEKGPQATTVQVVDIKESY